MDVSQTTVAVVRDEDEDEFTLLLVQGQRDDEAPGYPPDVLFMFGGLAFFCTP